MSARLADVTVVGEIYVDHVFTGLKRWPGPGEEIDTTGYHCDIGGGATITACALGRLGRTVKVMGVVGADQEAWMQSRLRMFGVDSSALSVATDSSGVTVALSTRADRSFFTYRGANEGLENCLGRPEVVDQLAASRHVHFATPLSRGLAAKLLPVLGKAGCHTSLDVGYQPAWLRDHRNWTTCGKVDCFMPNEEEASLLCGAAVRPTISHARASSN